MILVKIYSLSDSCTQQVRYIGKSVCPKNRYRSHISVSKNNRSHKANWIKQLKKQGLKPVLEEIDTVDETNWKFWEQHYISLFKSWNFKLVNSTLGGDDQGEKFNSRRNNRKGCKLSEEHKKLIGEAHKGSKNSMYGKKGIDHPKTGKKVPSCSKPVVEYSETGNIIKQYSSISECAKATGITATGISDVCHGRVKKVYKRIFKFE